MAQLFSFYFRCADVNDQELNYRQPKFEPCFHFLTFLVCKKKMTVSEKKLLEHINSYLCTTIYNPQMFCCLVIADDRWTNKQKDIQRDRWTKCHK